MYAPHRTHPSTPDQSPLSRIHLASHAKNAHAKLGGNQRSDAKPSLGVGAARGGARGTGSERGLLKVISFTSAARYSAKPQRRVVSGHDVVGPSLFQSFPVGHPPKEESGKSLNLLQVSRWRSKLVSFFMQGLQRHLGRIFLVKLGFLPLPKRKEPCVIACNTTVCYITRRELLGSTK